MIVFINLIYACEYVNACIILGDEEEAGRVATTLASLTKQLKASSKRQQVSLTYHLLL